MIVSETRPVPHEHHVAATATHKRRQPPETCEAVDVMTSLVRGYFSRSAQCFERIKQLFLSNGVSYPLAVFDPFRRKQSTTGLNVTACDLSLRVVHMRPKVCGSQKRKLVLVITIWQPIMASLPVCSL